MSQSDRTERLLNLLFALMSSARPVPKHVLRDAIDAYRESPSDEAFERMFERDKDELRGMGVPVETVEGSDGVGGIEGYRATTIPEPSAAGAEVLAPSRRTRTATPLARSASRVSPLACTGRRMSSPWSAEGSTPSPAGTSASPLRANRCTVPRPMNDESAGGAARPAITNRARSASTRAVVSSDASTSAALSGRGSGGAAAHAAATATASVTPRPRFASRARAARRAPGSFLVVLRILVPRLAARPRPRGSSLPGSGRSMDA